MSSSSRYVPRDAITRNDRARARSQRDSARSASSWTANRLPRIRRGDAESRASSASAREWAGSVDTTRVRALRRDSAIAAAEAQVVFPTPPLPA